MKCFKVLKTKEKCTKCHEAFADRIGGSNYTLSYALIYWNVDYFTPNGYWRNWNRGCNLYSRKKAEGRARRLYKLIKGRKK